MAYSEAQKLGEAVRILRNRKKMTQEVLAKKACIDTKYLREIEKGKHSVGLDIAIRICEALEVNRFELFVLAWRNDYFTFVEQWQRHQVNTKTKPNDEVSGIANKSKSLRVVTRKKEKSSTKCLLGGDKCGIIKIKLKNKLKNVCSF